jgi:hypothetical protein
VSIVNIISAIGNNSSVYPLLVRDCGIEIPSKLGMTYSQNLKDSRQMANNAFRERFIDEYGTSAIWIGGIPLMDKICDFGIKKLGYNPEINPNLFKETENQGLKKNIEKFKNLAPKETSEMEKVLKNKKTYERLLAGKFVLSTAIPIALMGYFLPKANFALTEKIREKQNAQAKTSDTLNLGVVDCFVNKQEEKPIQETFSPSFKGGMISTLSNMSTVNKMAVTDGGLTVGRVGTARNKFEKLEMGFKMLSMMFLNFVAPIWIAKGFDKASNKFFKTNVNLDPKIFNDKEFLEQVKSNQLELPKFSRMSKDYLGVKYLENGLRDPRAYVDIKKIKGFQNEIEKFSRQAKESGNVDKFAKKALKVKSANIIANVALSSFLLAVALPKLIFVLRKKVTGSDAEPGLVR